MSLKVTGRPCCIAVLVMDMVRRRHLFRHHLTLCLRLLHLSGMFPLVAMFRLHVGLHGGHTGHREAISLARSGPSCSAFRHGCSASRCWWTRRHTGGRSLHPLGCFSAVVLSGSGHCLNARSHRPIVPRHPKPSWSKYATSTPFGHWHTSITQSMATFSSSGTQDHWLIS